MIGLKEEINVEVGDEVLYHQGGSSGRMSRAKVEHVTATMVTVLDERFRRKNGDRVGEHSYYGPRIMPVTEENLQQMQDIEDRINDARTRNEFKAIALRAANVMPIEMLRAFIDEAAKHGVVMV